MINACSSGEQEQGQQLEYNTTEIEPEIESDSTELSVEVENNFLAFSDRAAKEFPKYFCSELMYELDDYLHEYNNLSTDIEFQSNYEKGIELFSKMYDAFDSPKTEYLLKLKDESEWWSPVDAVLSDLENLEGELGPIVFSCVAECTEMDFIYNQKQLEEKAKTTNGQSDDDFIALSIFNDGDYGCYSCWSWKSWFYPTWDLGGSSLLGEGIMLESIRMYMDFIDKYDNFEIEMKTIKDNYVDELGWTHSYMYSQEKVLAEYEEIFNLNLFSGEDLQKIMDTKTKIEAEDSEIQFDCETGDCSYG